MLLKIDVCQAHLPAVRVSDTLILHDASLDHLAHLATLVPRRRVNWQQTFARRGVDYKDYQLEEDYGHSYEFVRRADADFTLPERVRMWNSTSDAPGYSDKPLQGDILTYLVHELVLSFDKERSLSTRTKEDLPMQFRYLAAGLHLVGSLQDACLLWHDLDIEGQARFASMLTDRWTPSTFLQVESIIED